MKSLKGLVFFCVVALALSGCGLFKGEIKELELPAETVIEEGTEQKGSSLYGEKIAIDLTIPQNFNITRPVEEITTTYESYFITGTSNPDMPVYFGTEEVVRQGEKGVFGVLVDLEEGENTFVFLQGEDEINVTINRNIPSGEIQLISKITQDSMFPKLHAGVAGDSILEARCVAPAGAIVYASFKEEIVELKQVAVADDGVPAVFTGDILVTGDYKEGETVNAGPIEYTLVYDDVSTKFKSSGDVYVSSEGTLPAIAVTSYLGYVYPDYNDLTVFKELLKLGATDYIVGQSNSYFFLASGGYLPVSMARVLEGKVDIDNQINEVKHRIKDNGEFFVFSGNKISSYHVDRTENSIELTLYNTSGTPKINLENSEMFAAATIEEEGNWVVAKFIFNDPEEYWGYNVRFGGEKEIYFEIQKKPPLPVGILPLKGLVIIIDPGHGGTDAGANGLAGFTGPSESEINLAHAYSLENKLRLLGARVHLTQRNNETYSLDERLRDIPTYEADFFVSLHHNSVGENRDANDAAGTEVYYHTSISEELATAVVERVTAETGRSNRGAIESYYRVNILHYSPSILAELGFISNPLEYEKSCDWDEIDKVTTGIAGGIIKSLY